MMNERGKSDSLVVPAKSLNIAEGPAAEATKGTELTKGNSPEPNVTKVGAGCSNSACPDLRRGL
jgi:hypothetical protein